MTVEVATPSQLPAIQRLLHMARFVWNALASEDLTTVVARGMTLLAGEHAHPWGVLIIDPEVRPDTLADEAPDRAEVRAMALRHGPWLSTAGEEFGDALSQIGSVRPRSLQVSAYAPEGWQQRILQQAGFAQSDTVVFMHCHLDAGSWQDRTPQLSGVQLRPAELSDIPALATLDAATFIPLWHYSRAELLELLLRARMQVAIRTPSAQPARNQEMPIAAEVVGYSALLIPTGRDTHLARLAVHPSTQGLGIGRLLLDDAMAAAAASGSTRMALNTQLSNGRSQRLYKSAGFVETGVALPVYVRCLSGRDSNAVLKPESPLG